MNSQTRKNKKKTTEKKQMKSQPSKMTSAENVYVYAVKETAYRTSVRPQLEYACCV